ncbi:PepSY domain-containing protein [Pseudorhodoplanes sinuspersici]|uniref:Uncharacterized protein n=1 Tax=Pseudorhodoplanes sinuspersici TaxID=1235591 RepID=A0A1W6ZU94_9HYPH|nr:hypothetical protein [Pseudorhodoplanes sinuspersici]ARQ00967.1 hypothetical protein CAK95_19115 [Pseudorhodoplanes sinuspersici]RKE72602.1 putative membrane protein YkoI [Pseudorhodoplanes sinuspersici]
MSIRFLILAAAMLTAVLGASASQAAELKAVGKLADGQCLSPAQRRHVSASGKVVPLGKAIRAAKARRSEVVDAKLCKGSKGLVYLLTLLAHDGKVTRATVDAASGTLAEGG